MWSGYYMLLEPNGIKTRSLEVTEVDELFTATYILCMQCTVIFQWWLNCSVLQGQAAFFSDLTSQPQLSSHSIDLALIRTRTDFLCTVITGAVQTIQKMEWDESRQDHKVQVYWYLSVYFIPYWWKKLALCLSSGKTKGMYSVWALSQYTEAYWKVGWQVISHRTPAYAGQITNPLKMIWVQLFSH